MTDVDVGIDARRRLFMDLPDVADGYAPWLIAVENAARDIIAAYPEQQDPPPADRRVAEEILEHTEGLRVYWQTVEAGEATKGTVEGIAMLSASLASLVSFGWALEGKRSRHRVVAGGRKGGREANPDAEATRALVLRLHDQGLSTSQIAEKTCKTTRRIRQILSEEKKKGKSS